MPSSVNFKDISLLTQKSSVAGTEKIPVSDTEYITPSQIAAKAAVTDVTVGGTSVVSSGTAVIPAIPSAPGTLNTNNTTAQTASSSEALSGTIKLHKVAKTGTYSDLIGTPTIPAAPGTLVTNATTAQSASSGQAMSGTITLHKIAKTGTYSDLIGKPTIPSAPGTLNTTATTAQSTSASEALSGSVTLHKVAKTGTYSDLIGKPTIPSTLDQISDGSTRKLANYLPLAGGTMDVGASIVTATTLGNQYAEITPNYVAVYGPDESASIGQNYVNVFDNLTEKYTQIGSSSYGVYDEVNGTETEYKDGSISKKASNNTTYTLSLPSQSGTLAVTTDIPTVPTISTNITADATSDTKTASPKAVKTYVDGKVADYVPKSGGTMNDVASLAFSDGDYTSTTISYNGIESKDTDNGTSVAIDGTSPNVSVQSDSALAVYRDSGISYKPSSTTYSLNFPSKSGTIALTSDVGGAGTLNTTATTAQSTSASEALSGNITLHKVSKTGTYTDLIDAPPIAVRESTNDLELSDNNGYSIAVFSQGHIKTLNFDSSTALKYALCQNKAAYDAITTKDSGTLYLIPKV